MPAALCYCLRQVQLRSARSTYDNYVEICESDDGDDLQYAIAASFLPDNSETALHKYALSTTFCHQLQFRFVISSEPKIYEIATIVADQCRNVVQLMS